MTEHEWAGQISESEWQEITANALFGHAIEVRQDQRVSEKDRVVKECLGQHQNKSEQRAPPVLMHNRVPNFMPRGVTARPNFCRSDGVIEWWSNGIIVRRFLLQITPKLLYSITPACS